MKIYESLINKDTCLCVIGLGYVGLPLALAFSKKIDVIGFDIDKRKIDLYKKGCDPTKEVGNKVIKNAKMIFTSDEKQLKKANFFVISVPTPINQDKSPDLSPVQLSSKIVGKNLTQGSYVVYESTVYPGVTENICVKILEEESRLKCGEDFKVGYSPERINPGDKINKLETIKKIVSAQDKESLNEIAKVYELIIKAGIHKASSIKVAEAAKVVENSQRDINIAFMNELAMVFNRMNIDTYEVIKAMETKWNSLGFKPGLVGGHCIGVDPYYFLYEAEKLGYHSQIILSGRKINDSISKFIAENIIKKIIKADIDIKKAKVALLGITFKENCSDIRNSKAFDLINELNKFSISPIIVDPYADNEEVFIHYGMKLSSFEEINGSDVIIVAVAHDEYKRIELKSLNKYYNSKSKKVLIDVKSIFDLKELKDNDYLYWRL